MMMLKRAVLILLVLGSIFLGGRPHQLIDHLYQPDPVSLCPRLLPAILS